MVFSMGILLKHLVNMVLGVFKAIHCVCAKNYIYEKYGSESQ